MLEGVGGARNSERGRVRGRQSELEGQEGILREIEVEVRKKRIRKVRKRESA